MDMVNDLQLKIIVKTINVTEKTGKLIALKNVTDQEDLMVINKSGITIRIGVDTLRVMGRATQGVKLIRLRDEDSIASVAKVSKFESDDLEDDLVDNNEVNENLIEDTNSEAQSENDNQASDEISDEKNDEIIDENSGENDDEEPPNLFSDL